MRAQWDVYVGTMTSKIPTRCIVSMDVLSWERIKYNGESIRYFEACEHGSPFRRNARQAHEKRKRVITTILHVVCEHFELGRLHCTFADAISAELRKRQPCTQRTLEQTNKRQTKQSNAVEKEWLLKNCLITKTCDIECYLTIVFFLNATQTAAILVRRWFWCSVCTVAAIGKLQHKQKRH